MHRDHISSMKTSLLAVPVLVLLFLGRAYPQADRAPLPDAPSDPLLQSAPDFSQWEITFIYPKDPKSQPTAKPSGKDPSAAGLCPGKSVTTKTRHIVHEDSTDIDGHHSEKWHIGTLQYARLPGQTVWFESDAGRLADGTAIDANYSPFPASGFRDLDWISRTTYLGTLKFNDRDCLVFTPDETTGKVSADRAQQLANWESLPTVACVDAVTRLPVLVRINGETRRFTFCDPPAEMQVLPSDLAEQVKKAEEARTRLHQQPQRPY